MFAIAFTILVLDLNVPDGLTPDELTTALRALWPNLFSAVLSFAVIGRFWISHHLAFDRVDAADTPMLWLNTLLLALVALIPFSAALLAEYGDLPIAVIAYAGSVGATALAQLAVWRRATHRRRLAGERISDLEALRVTLGLGGAVLAFLLSIPLALVSTTAAQLCWLIAFVPGDRIAARWIARRRRADQDSSIA